MIADEDGTGRDAVLVSDLDDLLVLEERRISRAEGGVSLRDDLVLLEEVDELVLGEVRVKLDLRARRR